MSINKKLLIPVQYVKMLSGCFSISKNISIFSENMDDNLSISELKNDVGIIEKAFKTADIIFLRNSQLKDEGYKLEIKSNQISIYSSSSKGAYYATQTLRQLIKIYTNEIPCCVIDDYPDFKRRGIYYDCSRGKVPTVKTLCDFIERIAHWKINELQLYIENVFLFDKHPKISEGTSAFTPKDILEIQTQCEKYYIELVPSLASFGHTEKILALDDYIHLAEFPGFQDRKGGSTLCPTNPNSIKFIEELYSDFIPLFNSKEFNVCCDEPFELGQGKSKKFADKIGKEKVYLEYLMKIYDICGKYGKRMNFWGDIAMEHPNMIKEFPQDIVLMNWDYYWCESHGQRMAKNHLITDANIPCIVCPGVHGWTSHSSRIDIAFSNIADFAKKGREDSVDGLLNTDWGDGGHRNPLSTALHGYAYGAAQSWCGKNTEPNNYEFIKTFCFHSYNDDGTIANVMYRFGSIYKNITDKIYSTSHSYSNLVETIDFNLVEKINDEIPINSPLYRPKYFLGSSINNGVMDEFIKTLEGTPLADELPNIENCSEFDKITLCELQLGLKMEKTALEHGILVKRIRQGDKVNKNEIENDIKNYQEMIPEFESVWLKRNRLSRLNDNLLLLNNVLNEMNILK